MVVDEGEPTGSTALEATIATGSGETSFLDGGTYGVGETEICTSPELMYPGFIKEGAGRRITGFGDERSMTEDQIKETNEDNLLDRKETMGIQLRFH
ncbi:hypothetical protein Tco_0087486 [Tanacetum coccineum]